MASTAGQLRIVARVVAPEAGEIAARTAGTIIRYAVDVGDTVRAGAVLAELDRKSQTSTLALAKADLARAEAQAVLAREQMQRVQALRGSSAFCGVPSFRNAPTSTERPTIFYDGSSRPRAHPERPRAC